ncbi:MAG: cation:proton antiporter [Chloroflexia bacterium]
MSVASTVVLLRALMDSGALESDPGRTAVGWLIVEDMFTVLVLVLLPALAMPLGGEPPEGRAAGGNALLDVGVSLGKAALFGVLMYVVGRRAIPWILVRVARDGSQELFTLGVLAAALGIAWVYSPSGVAMLGAFFAGLVANRTSATGRRGRSASARCVRGAVLCLGGDAVRSRDPDRISRAGTVVLAVVVGGKALAAVPIVLALRRPLRTGLLVAAGLARSESSHSFSPSWASRSVSSPRKVAT